MPRPTYLRRIDERNSRRLARAHAGAGLLEALAYAAAVVLGLALSACWPLGFAA